MWETRGSTDEEDDQSGQSLSGQQGKKEEQNYFPIKMPQCRVVSSVDVSHDSHPIGRQGDKVQPHSGNIYQGFKVSHWHPL